MIFLRYQSEIEIQILKKNLTRPFTLLMSGLEKRDRVKELQWKMYKWMLIEFAVLSIHSLPRLNYNFTVYQEGIPLEYS